MSRSSFLKKVSSPVLSAGLGAAVCLSNGGAANAVTGNISASNTGQTVWSTTANNVFDILKLFSSQASFRIQPSFGFAKWEGVGGSARVARGPGGVIRHEAAGYAVKSSLTWLPGANFGRANQSDNFIPVQFKDGANFRYGWIHCVSTDATARVITLDTWGYNPTGAKINTLADSLSTKTLALSGGQAQLHWNNKNEQGVARYVVQAKNAVGEWTEVDSETPGAGRYSVKAPQGGAYRLVTENVDGTTEEKAF